jgi:glutamate racemase
MAERLANWLERHPEMEARLSQGGSYQVLTTDDPAWFSAFGERILGVPLDATKVRLHPVAG